MDKVDEKSKTMASTITRHQGTGQPKNQLLSRMSDRDIELLGPKTYVHLPTNTILEKANSPLDYAYFIQDGIASVIDACSENGGGDIGIIGFEGMTGLSMVLGDSQSPFETVMRCKGSALRIDAANLTKALSQSPTLKDTLLLYSRACTIQIATTALANANADILERVARLLLMISDRTSRTIKLSHDILGTMLSVRRAGVSEALQNLADLGVIATTRGQIDIKSRGHLVVLANGFYGTAESEYSRLLPSAVNL